VTRRVGYVLVLLAASCGARLGTNKTGQDGGGGDDGPPLRFDAPDGAAGWSTPQMIPGADLGNSANAVDDPNVTSNELELIYSVQLSGAAIRQLYVMTRTSTAGAWGMPTLINELSSTVDETSVRLSPDDLTIYFMRGNAIFTATRTAVGQPWSAPTALTEVNVTGDTQKWMAVCTGGYFVLTRAVPMSGTGADLYEGQLGNGPGTRSDVLSSANADNCAHLSSDCLTLYFSSNRADGKNNEIYMSTRTSLTAPWSAPVLADPQFNAPAPASQDDPWMADDGHLFVFTRQSTGVPNEIYYSTQ
jgi:hypothetical protein